MTYDETSVLRGYVFRYLGHLLTDSERERIAAEFSREKQAASDWFQERAKRQRAGQDDPEWKPLGPSPEFDGVLDDVVTSVLRELVRRLGHARSDSERERIGAELNREKQAASDLLQLGPSREFYGVLDDVVTRVLRDERAKALINRCPKCRSVLRTPDAKLCLWCGHSQYPA